MKGRHAIQLHLEIDELDVIANILLRREGQLSGAPQESLSNTHPGVDLKLCEELLDRILARDMEFDSGELERLAEILAAEKDAVIKIVDCDSGSTNTLL